MRRLFGLKELGRESMENGGFFCSPEIVVWLTGFTLVSKLPFHNSSTHVLIIYGWTHVSCSMKCRKRTLPLSQNKIKLTSIYLPTLFLLLYQFKLTCTSTRKYMKIMSIITARSCLSERKLKNSFRIDYFAWTTLFFFPFSKTWL